MPVLTWRSRIAICLYLGAIVILSASTGAAIEKHFSEASMAVGAAPAYNLSPLSVTTSPTFGAASSSVNSNGSTSTPQQAVLNTPQPQCTPPSLTHSCPTGYSRIDGDCRFLGCPFGEEIVAGLCVKAPKHCDPLLFCAGADTDGDGIGDDIMQRDASCHESRVQSTCRYGCNSGQCRPAPGGTGMISATPQIIHAGQQVKVSWSTKNMQPGSCKVRTLSQSVHDTGDGLNGSFTSSPLSDGVLFELSCQELSGAIFTQTTSVTVSRQ